MNTVRKIININEELCDGCGKCVPGCAEGALQIINGKARVISDSYCDGLGACIGECPTGALTIIERAAAEYDEDAVEKHLAEEKPSVLACGCPSTNIQTFETTPSCKAATGSADIEAIPGESSLSHWPVQIRLIPASAPFLKGADILVLADCSAVAVPALHRDLVKGKVVMMGCPKFDDVGNYVDKFADIFHTADIKSVTIVVMEVPCCSGLPVIVKKGMEKAGKTIPMEEMVVSLQGKFLMHS